MENTIEGSGIAVLDLRWDEAFSARRVHARDVDTQMSGLQRLSRAFVEKPEGILQELCDAAIQLCGADSAGISIERTGGTDIEFYDWIATAGDYSGFLDAILPRSPSACGICLERGYAQHFTVSQEFFDLLGVKAPVVTDGILLPWMTETTRGTIFVMAHGREEAFDQNDVRLMTMLADFAAMGYRQKVQREKLIRQERAEAMAEMANRLAHEINNPLQSLSNTAFLLAGGEPGLDVPALGRLMSSEIHRLSGLVEVLLTLPVQSRKSAL